MATNPQTIANPQSFADVLANYSALNLAVEADEQTLTTDQDLLSSTTSLLASAFAQAAVPGLAQVNADGSVTIVTVNAKGQVIETTYPPASISLPMPPAGADQPGTPANGIPSGPLPIATSAA
jgi:hypothetical protein